jgi:hypothetical protein
MGFNKPFHRNYRPVISGPNSGYSDWGYIRDRDYCENPQYYTRAFKIIQKDILNLFEFVEPSDVNCSTYSFRIHELLIRICIEIEANFKAILIANIFNPLYTNGPKTGNPRPEKTWNINDYKIINKTHHLDDYEIEFPIWRGVKNKRKPFSSWSTNGDLTWYQAYNKSKHDRIHSFHEANLDNLLDAFSGLCVLLTSQFKNESFEPGPDLMAASGYNYYDGETGIGDYLIVYFPSNWATTEMYDFDWSTLKNQKGKFNKIDYDNI